MTSDNIYHSEQLMELRNEISRLKEENDRLLKASKKADAANKAKSDFLAMISHEIRTPMNGVIGLTELLLDTEMDPKQQQFTSLIMTSARNLLTLINSLLDFSKIEAEMMELDIIEFDLKGLVEELMHLYSVSGQRKDVKVYAELDPQLADSYMGDSYRVRQILINLLGNGIKFTDKGSVVLRVRSCKTETGRECLRFEVQDSGPGIPSDKIDRLFKPFSQVDSSSTRRYGGTGLGLSICQKLIELMGGEIGVESDLGRGSTFWFNLPLSATGQCQEEAGRAVVRDDSVRQNEPPKVIDTPGVSAGPLVLIVEDDATNQFVLKTILERSGARIRIARNGRKAVEMYAVEDYDLIFMDCQMPVMDGFVATKEIHAAAVELSRQRPIIIALTADITSETRHRCKEVGMEDHLVKPIDFGKLQQVVDNWLPGARLRVISERQHPGDSGGEYLHIEDSGELNPIDTKSFEKLKQNMGDIRPVIRVFLESLPKRLRQLEDAVDKSDCETVRRLAHTLKGTSSQFGAVYLSSLSMRVENMAKAQKLDGIDLLLDKIRPATDMLVEFLAEELDKK